MAEEKSPSRISLRLFAINRSEMGIKMGKADKVIGYLKDYGVITTIKKLYHRFNIKYRLGKKYCSFVISKEQRAAEISYHPREKIKISIIVPVYNPPKDYFEQMIESVTAQTYQNWELCLADASDSENAYIEKISEKYISQDDRIKYKKIKKNNGISSNSNEAANMATGEYIALLDHDDLLHPSALYNVATMIETERAEFIYTDELSFAGKPQRVQSINLKPDFSWETFRYNNFICHFTVFKKDIFKKAGGFHVEFEGAQDYDIFLRMLEKTKHVSHIPLVLYYWRIHENSSSSGIEAKPYIVNAGIKALEEHYKRIGLEYENIRTEFNHGPFYKTEYKMACNPKVKKIVQDESENVKNIRKIKKDIENQESDFVILERKKYHMYEAEEKTENLIIKELIGCLTPKENMAVSNTVLDGKGRYINAGWCYNNEWKEKFRPLYKGVSIKDAGYMNRLHFRQVVSLLDGSMLAVKSEIILKWLGKKDNEENIDIFSRQSWFEICMEVNASGGNCVVTPYYPVVSDKDNQKEMNRQKVEMNLERKDRFLNKCMEVFGKSYELW